jgi:hypothetical protein
VRCSLIRTGQGQHVREGPTPLEHEGLGAAEGRSDHCAHPGERFWHPRTVAPAPFQKRFWNVGPRPGARNRTHSAHYHELLELLQKTRLLPELQRIQRSLLRCTQAGMVVAVPAFVRRSGIGQRGCRANAAPSVFDFAGTKE